MGHHHPASAMREPHPTLVMATIAVAVVGCLAAAHVLARTVAYATGGNHPADVCTGVLLVILPAVAIRLAGTALRQHARACADAWVLGALWGPALALLPFAKGQDLDPGLVAFINHGTPGLIPGLVAGAILVLVVGAVLFVRTLADVIGRDQ